MIEPGFPPMSWNTPSTIDIAERTMPSVQAHGCRPQAPQANNR